MRGLDEMMIQDFLDYQDFLCITTYYENGLSIHSFSFSKPFINLVILAILASTNNVMGVNRLDASW